MPSRRNYTEQWHACSILMFSQFSDYDLNASPQTEHDEEALPLAMTCSSEQMIILSG